MNLLRDFAGIALIRGRSLPSRAAPVGARSAGPVARTRRLAPAEVAKRA